jgi:hypothetical protein
MRLASCGCRFTLHPTSVADPTFKRESISPFRREIPTSLSAVTFPISLLPPAQVWTLEMNFELAGAEAQDAARAALLEILGTPVNLLKVHVPLCVVLVINDNF